MIDNDPVNYVDYLGLRLFVYRAHNEVKVWTPNYTKKLSCGSVTLERAYADASIGDNFKNSFPQEHNDMMKSLPSEGTTVPPITRGTLDAGGFIGAGFRLRFSPDSKDKTCCKKFLWRQYIGTKVDSDALDYEWSMNPSATDFPGTTYSGFFDRDKLQNFYTQLICIKTDGSEEVKLSVSWSTNTTVRKSPTSATMVLEINIPD